MNSNYNNMINSYPSKSVMYNQNQFTKLMNQNINIFKKTL